MCMKAIVNWILRRVRRVPAIFLALVAVTVLLGSCSGTGACVGSGGSVLSSPVCKEEWTKDECREWDDEEINDADWTFRGGDSCDDLVYTDRCSDGSYRLPGDC